MTTQNVKVKEAAKNKSVQPAAKAEMLIRKPVSEVFEALVNPDITSKFWFTKGSYRLQEGKTIEWEWGMYDFKLIRLCCIAHNTLKINILWHNFCLASADF